MEHTMESIPLHHQKNPDRLFPGILRIIVSFGVPILTGVALWWSFTFMRDADANKFASQLSR